MAVENVSIRLSADAKKIDAVLDRIDARLKKISSKSISLTTKGSTKAIDEVAAKMSKIRSKGVDVTVSPKGFDKVEQAQRRLATAQARLQDQLGKGASSTTIGSTVTQIGTLQNRLNQLKSADISAPFIKAGAAVKNLGDRVSSIGSQLTRLSVVAGAALGTVATKTLKFLGEQQRAFNDTVILLGDNEGAARKLSKTLSDFDIKSPFSLGQLNELSNVMAVSIDDADALGVKVKELADLSGGSFEKASRSAVTMQQVFSKGFLDLRDFRELTTSSPALAKELRRLGLVADGMQVPLDKVNEAMSNVTAGFKRTETAARSLPGLMSSVTSIFQRFGAAVFGIDLSEGFKVKQGGLFDKISTLIAEIVDNPQIKAQSLKLGDAISQGLTGSLGGVSGKGVGELISKLLKSATAAAPGAIASTVKAFKQTSIAVKEFMGIVKSISPVFSGFARLIGGGDIGVGMGRLAAATILLGKPLKILGSSLKGIGLAIKGIQFARLTKELGGLANVAAAGGKFSGLASTLTSVGGAVSKIPGGGGLISLLANPYVLGGAAVLGGIALAAKAIDSALNFKNNATLTTENFNSALANLRAEGLQPSATAVQDLKDKFDQYAKSGIVPTVEEITEKFKEQEVQVRAVRDRFMELKAEGVPAEEALTKAIEEQNAKLREQNQIKAAQKDFAEKELENQIKNQKVVTDKGNFGIGKKEITIDKLLKEQLDKFRSAAKANILVLSARVKMLAPEGVNQTNVNKLIQDLMRGDKGDVTVDALGRVNIKLKDGVQVDPKELETAKNAMQAEIDERMGEFPANVSLTVDGQKFEGNIVEVRRQIEEKLGQSPHLKDDILANLNITPNIEAGDLSGQIAGLVASIPDKAELSKALSEKIFGTIAFTPAQIGALQQNGIEAGTIFSAAIASSAFKGLQTTEDKVQFLNNTLKQLSGDVNFAVNLENPQETIDKLIQLGVIKDDATKAAIIEVFANSGIAEDKLAVVKEKVNAIPTDKTVSVNAVDNTAGVFDKIRRNLAGLTGAALNIIGRSSGGVVPSYRSSGGIIDKPKYYSKGTSFVDWKPRGTDNVPAMLTRGEGVIKVPSMGIIGRGAFAKLNSGNRDGVLAGAKELVNRLGGSAGQVITNNTSESNSPVTNNSITQEFNFNSSNNSGNLNSMWRARSILGSVI